MTCPACGVENRVGAQFCRDCGARQAVSCHACGVSVEPGSKFCDGCGAPTAPARAAEPSASAQAPDVYTPRHLADRILRSRTSLEGERKHVTVLFADLRGSLELLVGSDPEEARALLDAVVERMMDPVHRFNGTVNQVMGDGIMALFGAPVALEDHALRACYAALAMQQAIDALAAERATGDGAALAIRVGLNSGEVVVRAIGSDLRMDYTAVGQTTHLAARMEQLALPGTIAMTAATLRLVEGFVEAEPRGPVAVKGLSAPVEVFQLVGTRRTRTRLQTAAARGLTRFVGRRGEIGQLDRALELAGRGQGQIVALVGEPGVGKSRLVWEFTHSDRCRGWLVLESYSVSLGRAASYLPVIEMLKSHFLIEDRDDPRKIAEKVTGKVLSMGEGLEASLPALLTLLDVPVDDPQWTALEPRQRRQRTLDGLRRLLLRESQIQPLLVVFEDLHWIDTETQAFLDALVASLPAARVLLLVNYRPNYQHAWANRANYTQLRIDDLTRESTNELLDAILGPGPGLGPVRDFLVRQTDGNPFFLEESLSSLVETGVLVGERGAYRMAGAPTAIQVPATVQAIVAARIDRLPPEEKDLLETAAVIGKDVPLALLEAVVDVSGDALQQGLARLVDGEFVYETMLFPEIEYTFRHALTHEVAYGGLLRERRRAAHTRIVAAMERLYAYRINEQIERLATHALRAELWPKAVTYLRQAGAKAMARSANAEAVSWLEQALGALASLPPGRATTELAVDIRFDLRNAFFALGDLPALERVLTEAGELVGELGDRRREGWVAAYMSHYHWRAGDLVRSIEVGQRALAAAAEVDDLGLETTHVAVGLSYYGIGEYHRAVECFRRIIGKLHGDDLRERFGWAGVSAVLSRAYLAGTLAELGEFAEGVGHGEDAIRIAESADHPFSLGQALVNLGGLHVRRGDLDQAIQVLEHCMEICRIADVPALFASTASSLGYAYALAGRLDEGLRLLERGVAEAGARKITARESLWMSWLADACLLAGDVGRGSALADQAVALAASHGSRGNHAFALRVRAEAAHRAGRPAEALYRDAVERAAELGMRPLEAQARVGLAGVLGDVGRPAEARAELDRAAEMFRAMQMPRWLARAESLASSLPTG